MAHPQPSRKHSACLSRVSRKQCNCRREKVGQPPLPGCRKLCHGRSAAASRSLCLLGRPLRMRLGEHMLIRRRISYAALPFFWRLEPADSVILLQPVRRHKRVSGPCTICPGATQKLCTRYSRRSLITSFPCKLVLASAWTISGLERSLSLANTLSAAKTVRFPHCEHWERGTGILR